MGRLDLFLLLPQSRRYGLRLLAQKPLLKSAKPSQYVSKAPPVTFRKDVTSWQPLRRPELTVARGTVSDDNLVEGRFASFICYTFQLTLDNTLDPASSLVSSRTAGLSRHCCTLALLLTIVSTAKFLHYDNSRQVAHRSQGMGDSFQDYFNYDCWHSFSTEFTGAICLCLQLWKLSEEPFWERSYWQSKIS